MAKFQIRSLEPACETEIHWVAIRMQRTLGEVLGPEEETRYSLEWLRERVLWHLKSEACTGAVYLAKNHEGNLLGYTIVRVEEEEDGPRFGLFSTTYVESHARRQGVAKALLDTGEKWMREHGLSIARTYTARDNDKLITLYAARGYTLSQSSRPDMIILSKDLSENPSR